MIKLRLVGLLSHAKKYILYTVIWQELALLSQVGAVFCLAGFLEELLYTRLSAKLIGKTALFLFSVICLRFLCERMATRASYLAGVDVKRVLREKIYEKTLKLKGSYKGRVSSAELVQVCTEGVEQLEIYFGKYLPQLFYSLLAPATLFFILFKISLHAALILLACLPLIPLSIAAVQRFAKRLLHKYWAVYTGLGDSFLENLQGMTTLKIYGADQKKAEQMDKEAQTFRKITMRVLIMQLNSILLMDIVAYGGAAAGMAVAVSEFLKGEVGLRGVICIILLAAEFFLPLRLLGSFFHIAMNGMAASDKIFEILDLPEEEEKEALLGDQAPDICLKDVRFAYEEEREILKGLSFSIRAGSFISLVGESGCGKSTLAGLLSGRLAGYKGQILIGGISLSQIKESCLRERIVLLGHNSYLFKGTVEENLRMAKKDADEEELKEVLKKVNLWDFLQGQAGLQTGLSERAGNLSGGQRQRLALARALLDRKRQVYIFDEASSNIDAESEEKIMELIRELAREKTVVLISHRLANVVDSDCIYFLKEGEIREAGSHGELMQRRGDYYCLYERQRALENYKKGEAYYG